MTADYSLGRILEDPPIEAPPEPAEPVPPTRPEDWRETWQTPTRRPEHGDVYRDRETGAMWLFIAEGTRDPKAYYRGKHADSELAWHFCVTIPEKRISGRLKHPADVPLPPQLDLVVNAGAEDRVAELEARVAELDAERVALTSAMKAAVGVLPPAVANHLRETYRQHRGQLLTKGAK